MLLKLKKAMSSQTDFNELLIKDGKDMKVIAHAQNKILDTLNEEILAIDEKAENIISKTQAIARIGALRAGFNRIASKITRKIHNINDIIIDGKAGRLSHVLMSPNELSKVISNINNENKILSPIFAKNEVSKYYEPKLLTIFWHGKTLHTLMRIPLIDFRVQLKTACHTSFHEI